MLEVSKLSFDYPGTRALNDISFRLREGSITALVGPNGAGKTTLLRCLAALEEPAAGSIRLDGRELLGDPRASHRQLGYLSDFFGLYQDLTARQCLTHAARCHNIAKDELTERIRWSAEQLGLGDRLEDRAGALSRGQRQRLAIAQAIIHRPRYLLLDEPASGLDPEARYALALLFRHLQKQGMTILVSSHILSELEEYSTDMLVLRQGRIVDHAPLQHKPERVSIEVRLTEPSDAIATLLNSLDGYTLIATDDRQVTIDCAADDAAQHRLLMTFIANGLKVCSFAVWKQNIQQTYLRSIKQQRNEGGE